VHLFIGDARELLLTTPQRYDLIFSEPSNPYRAGVASLFTREFYRAATARLDEGGLFVQWLQTYNVDAQTVRTIYATLASVFPVVESWMTEEADLLLVASARPIRYDVGRLRARIAEEPWRSALHNVWRSDDLEGVFARFLAGSGLARAIARAEGDHLNTDDRTRVEFGFARGLGLRKHEFELAELKQAAHSLGVDRPPLQNGSIDFAALPDRRLSASAADWYSPDPAPPDAPPDFAHRVAAFDHWIDGELGEALAEWRRQPAEPADSMQLALVGETLAEAGDDAAIPYLERLAAAHPIEAAALRARLQLRRHRAAEAAATLAQAFASYRSDPWPLPHLMARALDLAVEIAVANPAAGARLYAATAAPFATYAVDDLRQQTRFKLAMTVDAARLCVEALAALEPEVPFRRDLLEPRLRCYQTTHHALLGRAERDLERYRARVPEPFLAGLTRD
jgi:hypothetical protein